MCCVLLWIFHKYDIFLFQSLASHFDRFVEEEVEVRHIPHLSDGDLKSLGSVTIGSRQRICSAATAWVPQVIRLCSFDSHVLKKVLYKCSDMFFFSREIWYQKSDTYVSLQTPGGAGGDGCWTNSRCEWGRRREWGLVNWLMFRKNMHLQQWIDWKIFTTQLVGTEFSGKWQQGRAWNSRCERGRWREICSVNWFGAEM